MIQPNHHYCVNTPQLLGKYATRDRHLALLGYEVIEVVISPSSLQNLHMEDEPEPYKHQRVKKPEKLKNSHAFFQLY